MKKHRHWKKRYSKIGRAVSDPAMWEYRDRDGSILATVREAAGPNYAVALATRETAGPFGDLAVAKQSAVKRIARQEAGLAP